MTEVSVETCFFKLKSLVVFFIQGGVEALLVASCYRNRDKSVCRLYLPYLPRHMFERNLKLLLRLLKWFNPFLGHFKIKYQGMELPSRRHKLESRLKEGINSDSS